MTMTADEARAVEREPIMAGNTYTFYSEVHDTTVADCSSVARRNLGLIDLPGVETDEEDQTPLRMFTGRDVEVIRRLEVPEEADEECSPAYVVQVIGTKTRDTSMRRVFWIGLGGFLLYCFISTYPPSRLPVVHYPTLVESCPSSNQTGYCEALRWQEANPHPSTSLPPNLKPASPDLYKIDPVPTSSTRQQTSTYTYRTTNYQPYQSKPYKPPAQTSTTYRTSTSYPGWTSTPTTSPPQPSGGATYIPTRTIP